LETCLDIIIMNVDERFCNCAFFLVWFYLREKIRHVFICWRCSVLYSRMSDFSEKFSSSVIHILLLRYLHLNLDSKLLVCYGNDHAYTYTLLRNHNNSNKLAATITFFFHENRKRLAAITKIYV